MKNDFTILLFLTVFQVLLIFDNVLINCSSPPNNSGLREVNPPSRQGSFFGNPGHSRAQSTVRQGDNSAGARGLEAESRRYEREQERGYGHHNGQDILDQPLRLQHPPPDIQKIRPNTEHEANPPPSKHAPVGKYNCHYAEQ